MDIKLELVIVPVTDVDRSKEFYVDKVGFHLDHDQTVADADAIRAELLGRGVDASEVEEHPWGRFVFFADPDGNRWSLQQVPAWG